MGPRMLACSLRQSLIVRRCVSECAVPRALTVSRASTARRGTQSSIQDQDQESIDLQPPRGTRDFYPEEMRLRKWLFGEFATVSEQFGFEQYDSPVLESEALFVRKAGEEIRDQLFNFKDKGDRSVALRPELTPSLSRMYLAKARALGLPVKWYNIGQCWRYERMTRGRRREHYQWNMDIIGVPGVAADAELLSAITTFFTRLGLTADDIKIRVNSRKVLQTVAQQSGISVSSFSAVCVILDKLEKISEAQVKEQLQEQGVEEDTANKMLAVMACRSVEELEQVLGECEALEDLQELFALAEGYGFHDWLECNASVVRGLAYYTGMVFEAFDRKGELRAICGGGRYDRLLGTFGGENVPMVGFGFGDAVIMELLAEKGLVPELRHSVDDVVVCMDESLRANACGVATKLRSAGRQVDVVLVKKKMNWTMKHVQRLGAKRMVIVGAREWENGCVRVKDLDAREEADVKVDELQ